MGEYGQTEAQIGRERDRDRDRETETERHRDRVRERQRQREREKEGSREKLRKIALDQRLKLRKPTR